MATDQSLLDLAENQNTGFLRLYRWSPHCLSFGRNEPALRRYNREEIERRGIAVVRRPTGGRAVWHARELTYAVAAPVDWFGTLTETYHAIHRILAHAVELLGINATLAPITRSASLTSGACFASPAGGEVLLRGRKLIGSAQLRQGNAFLQHGSILLEDDQQLVAELTRGEAPRSDEITLREAAGRAVGFEEVAEAVLRAFVTHATSQGEQFPRPSGTRDDVAVSAQHLLHFADPGWTWRR